MGTVGELPGLDLWLSQRLKKHSKTYLDRHTNSMVRVRLKSFNNSGSVSFFV